jgi:hypothetical protein
MNWSIEKYRHTQIVVWIQEGIFLLVCFLYLFLDIHPVLMIKAQPPVFFMTSDFLKDFLLLPGGLTDWLSALLMQFWFSDLISSIVLTVCIWSVMVLTKVWMDILLEKHQLHSFHLIPAGLLLVFHSQYDFHFSITVALIINLLVLTLFLRWAPEKQIYRTLWGLVISLLLYWVTGGASFLFVVLFGFDELIKKRFVGGGLVLFISGILPYIASLSFILVPLRYAYIHNLSFELPLELWVTGYLLPAFFVLTFVFASLARYIGTWELFKKIDSLDFLWKLTAGTILIVGATILLFKESMNDTKRHVLLVNRAVTDERWSDVLSLTKYCSNETPLILSQSNLALYQTGKLLDSMFAYPQSKGTLGLLMNQPWSLSWSEEASDVNWRLGLVNESQHWAHEAFEHKGATSDLLKKLGKIYLVKGNHEVAKRYFLNLKDVPFQGKTAEYYLRLNENPAELAQDYEYQYIQSIMPTEDLISRGKASLPKLELLLKRNPRNRMAFEYMIADLLLTGNLKEIFDHVPDFHSFHYALLPRHVQEAIILVASLTPNIDLTQLKSLVLQSNFKRFLEYRQILLTHGGDRYSTMQDLKGQYGDTYWYYFMFVKPASRPSESQNEFQ